MSSKINAMVFIMLLHAVSSGREMKPTNARIIGWHLNIDKTVGRHREPHVVRVGVDRLLLIPSMHSQVHSIALISLCSVERYISVDMWSGKATKHCRIEQNFPCGTWYSSGNTNLICTSNQGGS